MRNAKPARLLPLLPLIPFAAGAACGTNFCPRQPAGEPSAWQVRWSVERSGYDLAGASGTYSIAMLELGYRRADAWIAAFHVPYISLDAAGGERHGLGNPMALAEYRWHPSPNHTLGAGTQVEFAWGDHDRGLAQPHYMAVPYLSGSARGGGWILGGNLGVSFAFGGSHEEGGARHHAAPDSPVHPHEDLEAVYRVSLGRDVPAWRIRPAAFVNGQRVLAGDGGTGAADDYLSAGVEAPVSFGNVDLIPQGEFPITAERRFEWSFGLACGVRF